MTEPRLAHEANSALQGLTVLLALTLGAGTAYLAQQRSVSLARGETAQAREAARDVAASLHQSEDQRHALERALALKSEEASSSEHRTGELSPEVLAETVQVLQKALAAEIKGDNAHLSVQDGSLRIELSDALLFESGQTGVSGRGAELLGRVAPLLGRVNGAQFQIAGHVDDARGGERARLGGWELSAAHAVSVVRFLAEHRQMRSEQLSAVAFGAVQPVVAKATPQARARNRRVEITVWGAEPPPSARAGRVSHQRQLKF